MLAKKEQERKIYAAEMLMLNEHVDLEMMELGMSTKKENSRVATIKERKKK